MEIRKAEGHL